MASHERRAVLWGLALLASGAVTASVFIAGRDDPTSEEAARRLLEDARRLHDVEPMSFGALRLGRWTRDDLTLRAEYSGGREWFTIRLWPTSAGAKDWFEDAVRGLATKKELGYMNGVSGVQYCHDLRGATRCVGYDENRTLVAESARSDDSQRAVNAGGLVRTARKHWYRVMGGTSDTP